jgi:phosphoenolpyruvate carboxykinase (ATP)
VPQVEHTELENELHEKAHIDYDRVAIVCLDTSILQPLP